MEGSARLIEIPRIKTKTQIQNNLQSPKIQFSKGLSTLLRASRRLLFGILDYLRFGACLEIGILDLGFVVRFCKSRAPRLVP